MEFFGHKENDPSYWTLMNRFVDGWIWYWSFHTAHFVKESYKRARWKWLVEETVSLRQMSWWPILSHMTHTGLPTRTLSPEPWTISIISVTMNHCQGVQAAKNVWCFVSSPVPSVCPAIRLGDECANSVVTSTADCAISESIFADDGFIWQYQMVLMYSGPSSI